jgi:NAD(P)H dehydrogenase (quinone)
LKVTKGQIDDAVAAGATTLAEVMEKTKAGTACGGCKGAIQSIIDSHSHKPLVLVIGATGHIGSRVASQLLASGEVSVRAAVRDPAKAASLAASGAQVVKFDWAEKASVRAAFAGTQRVFALFPLAFSWVDQAREAVEAAKEAKVQFLTTVSGAGANPTADFWVAKEHGMCEQVVAESGIPFAIFQPTFFMENIVEYNAPTIKSQGAIYGHSDTGKVPFVAVDDIAAVISTVLRTPEKYAGQRFYITGAEAFSAADVAGMVSAVAGKTVTYTDVAAAGYKAAMMGNGIPEKIAQGLLELEIVKRNGWAANISGVVQQVTGRSPVSLKSFIEEHKAQFI